MSKVSDVKKRNAACCIGERGRCRTGRGRAIAVGRRNKIRLTVAMAEGYHKYETCETGEFLQRGCALTVLLRQGYSWGKHPALAYCMITEVSDL